MGQGVKADGIMQGWLLVEMSLLSGFLMCLSHHVLLLTDPETMARMEWSPKASSR